jgi:hypothetical protein
VMQELTTIINNNYDNNSNSFFKHHQLHPQLELRICKMVKKISFNHST